jgi:hypothetical protein
MMLKKLNERRVALGFPIISEEIRTLEFAEILGVGNSADLIERQQVLPK